MRSTIKREAAAKAMYPKISKERAREKEAKYQQKVIPQTEPSGAGHAHELNGDLGLGIAACQGVDV